MRFTQEQEMRFRRHMSEASLRQDLWCSLIILLGLTSVLPRLTYDGPQGTLWLQALLFGGIFVSHALPPMIIWTRGREHYLDFRHIYLPAFLALDFVGLLKLRCWRLMAEIQSGQPLKLLFAVYNMCTGHLVLHSLGRNMLFWHHVVGHTALAAAALRSLWRHCLQLRCKFGSEFRTTTSVLSKLLLPVEAVLPSPFFNSTALEQSRPQGPEGCIADCFVVHGQMVVTVGYLIPLLIVYKREQLLRKRFLEGEAEQQRRERQLSRPSSQAQITAPQEGEPAAEESLPPTVRMLLLGNQAVLCLLALSFLSWLVHHLADGGMAAMWGSDPDVCPGVHTI